MEFEGQFPVGALQIVIGGILGYAEDLVVILGLVDTDIEAFSYIYYVEA